MRVRMSSGEAYVRVEGRLSPAHARVLSQRFHGDHWRAHVEHMFTMRPVVALDLYADRSSTQHLGSIVLSKFLVRSGGTCSPLVSIESMASTVERRGVGEFLFSMARALLFTDAPNVPCGGIVAQCVTSVPFWDDLLDANATAQAVTFQMHNMYSSFDYEDGCTMRYTQYKNLLYETDACSSLSS